MSSSILVSNSFVRFYISSLFNSSSLFFSLVRWFFPLRLLAFSSDSRFYFYFFNWLLYIWIAYSWCVIFLVICSISRFLSRMSFFSFLIFRFIPDNSISFSISSLFFSLPSSTSKECLRFWTWRLWEFLVLDSYFSNDFILSVSLFFSKQDWDLTD